MVTLSSFRRRLPAAGRHADVELPAGRVRWPGAQDHAGENIGHTETHSIFAGLKENQTDRLPTTSTTLGPHAD